jgi:hypothetical protein
LKLAELSFLPHFCSGNGALQGEDSFMKKNLIAQLCKIAIFFCPAAGFDALDASSR